MFYFYPYSTDQPFRADELGPLLRALREHRGLTLRENADELGVSASALSQAERNVSGVERLALRAVNEHLARATAEGTLDQGRVRHEYRADGSALEILQKIRGPERERRAGLLRQALLARQLLTWYNDEGFFVDIMASVVRVDLDRMTAHLVRHGDSTKKTALDEAELLGVVVDLNDETLDDESWAQAIDRFASALVRSSPRGLDVDMLRHELQRPLVQPFDPADPDVPMT